MAQPLTDASQAASATRRITMDISVGMASSLWLWRCCMWGLTFELSCARKRAARQRVGCSEGVRLHLRPPELKAENAAHDERDASDACDG